MSARDFAFEGDPIAVDEEGEGPVFAFQHGLCGDAAQAADAFPRGAGWRRATLEMPGHGRSPPGDPARPSIARYADALAAWIEARARAPVVVGGISMGAAIALRLAVVRPDLVRALALVRPAWLFEAAPPNMAMYGEVGDLLAAHGPARGLALFRASDLAARLAREAPDNLATFEGFFAREPASATAELLRRIARDGPGIDAEDAARIGKPTIVVGNRRDAAHPIGFARDLARAIPGARFVEVAAKADDRARHLAEVRAALAQFLEGLMP
ncbi:MAG: alpha/beta fold hydrolase [Hyphomicrobiales bacterium]|nr:alpha/beta fold hydrolase [Hyphomicrobiales bacterium]